MATKRTYQPKVRRRIRVHGFRSRMETADGRKVLYPSLKITMFTIPLLCSREWLEMVYQSYPWIQMHYHGSDHKNRDEWLNNTNFSLPFGEYFYKGFKAPWWRLGQPTADTLASQGYVISTCRNYFDVQGPRIYRYNLGQEHIPSVWYEGDYHSIHSHVQTQKLRDGLPDGNLLDRITKAFPRDTQFMFVSELF